MRRKKILCATLIIAGLSTMFALKTYAAEASMPNGTVVIGAKAFDLAYANDPKNLDEIKAALVVGGSVYVKDFTAVWIDNTSAKTVSATSIPSVIYKGPTGTLSNYAVGDILNDTTTSLEVISIE
ncbi:hypothetical protein [Clostridium tagluense]|uniref:Uncharacterized protein n=1 Tax=Clostridium tagluense TaxID=360422 RepID=A0A401URB8_9CLOT|nr:hypothetical protein [Clostridium tagluense]GCD12071.1 hypothetical protein Ctaglu_36940 [Clostridium tagluense]